MSIAASCRVNKSHETHLGHVKASKDSHSALRSKKTVETPTHLLKPGKTNKHVLLNNLFFYSKPNYSLKVKSLHVYPSEPSVMFDTLCCTQCLVILKDHRTFRAKTAHGSRCSSSSSAADWVFEVSAMATGPSVPSGGGQRLSRIVALKITFISLCLV